MEIAELRADGHHVFQAAAGQRHLAAKALRHINNLLHTVHVGGKRRDDQPAVPSFCEKALKGFNVESGSPAEDINANNYTLRQRSRMLYMSGGVAAAA